MEMPPVFEDFRNCLHEPRDCETFAHWLIAPLSIGLKQVLRGDKSRQPVSILDIGSGGGGYVTAKIWKWAQRSGRETYLTGVGSQSVVKTSRQKVSTPGWAHR